jgi:hypothetical protein
MSEEMTPPITRTFQADQTIRWSCRAGEYVLWVGVQDFFASDRASGWTIHDFWQMRDGSMVCITNRSVDLPVWFDLHPTEVAGAGCSAMMARLDAGYEPDEPMAWPNLWRAKAGDRLVWVTTLDNRNPVREVLKLNTCVAAIGEENSPSMEGVLSFVGPSRDLTSSDAIAMRAGFDAAVALGAPRVFAPAWLFEG